jgi:YebC/PmpR family DNA-binding regulatory protein
MDPLTVSLREQLVRLLGEAPEHLVEHRIDRVAELLVLRPADWERVRDEEAVAKRPVPYWGLPWPSGQALARHLAAADLSGRRVLELGCGLGLVAAAAARAGGQVTAVDSAPAAVAYAAHTLALNDVTGEVAVAALADVRGPFDLVLAADVLYTQETADDLARVLPGLAPEAWIADPGRTGAKHFLAVARHRFALRSTPIGDEPPVRLHRLVLSSSGMAGHSKWAGIKHKKAIVDARRGKLFTKLARAITVAAKEGGGDPDGNPALALAISKAKDASMPKDNIERAIAKGTGAGADAEALEAVVYEGYGPGGVAIMVEATTDNRNRTGAEMRHTFSKHGGNMGEPGSVAYLFDKRGLVLVDGSRFSEDDLLPAIEAGALDVTADDDVLEVLTEPSDLHAVRQALIDAGVEVDNAELAQLPKTRVPLDEATAEKVLRLVDALEENDDVDAVHANFEADAEVLERVAG